MKNTPLFYLQFVLLLFFLVIPLRKTNAQHNDHFISGGRKIDAGSFDKKIQHLMEGIGAPGLSLAIIEDGQIAYTNAYGYKDLSKKYQVTQQTVFEAASLSKSFLVFVVFKLVDRGLLDLDKPMYQYMPLEALAYDQRNKLITPRMILSHSSGIENWTWDFNPDVLEIVSDPGERYVYSGEGYEYLAKVVEGILDKSYEDYVTDMILNPFRLESTYLRYDSLSPSNYATGYTNFDDEVKKWKNKKTSPASGIHLTASDYATLVLETFNKKNISGGAISKMLQPQITMAEEGSNLYYGLGYEVLYVGGDTIVMHGGNNDGFKAQLFYSVVKKRGFVYLANHDLGKSLSTSINELSANLSITPAINLIPWAQYPGITFDLLKIYKEQGKDAMLTALSQPKVNREGLKQKALIELSLILMAKDMDLTRELLKEYIQTNTNSSMAYYLLGQAYMAANDFDIAYQHFKKAEELNFLLAPVTPDLKKCEAQLVKK